MSGVQVIATTSTAEKAARLRAKGNKHVIICKEDLQWGETAKKISHHGRRADFVIEIGGANTMTQSTLAVAIDREVTVIGSRAGEAEDGPSSGSNSTSIAIIRGIVVGSRQLSEAMNAAIEVNNLHSVIEPMVLKFSDIPKAYDDFVNGDHFGKVVVDFD